MNVIWRRNNIVQCILRSFSNKLRIQSLPACCYHIQNVNKSYSITNLKSLNLSYNAIRHKSKVCRKAKELIIKSNNYE